MEKKTVTAGHKPNVPDPMLVALVAQFLENNGFRSAHRIFNTERKKRPKKEGWQDSFAKQYTAKLPPLETVFKTWKTQGSQDESSTDSDSTDVSKTFKKNSDEAEQSSSSDEIMSDPSSNDDDISERDQSSDDSSDEDDTTSVQKNTLAIPKTSLKRMASESLSESSSESEVETKTRPAKKQRIQSPPSSPGSGSNTDDSTSESDTEDLKVTHAGAVQVTANMSDVSESNTSANEDSTDSEASSESSSSSDSDSDSAEEPVAIDILETAAKTRLPSSGSSSSSNSSDSSDSESSKVIHVKTSHALPKLDKAPSDSSGTVVGDTRARASASDSSGSEEAVTVAKVVVKEKTHMGAHPTRLAQISAAANMDDYVSNDYISYEYADKAYRDLSITRGKGFTKEKNKKKRGSYRGGAIDISGGKAFKFDD